MNKYQEAIKIMKDKLGIDVTNIMIYINNEKINSIYWIETNIPNETVKITEEEYELLKEVFDDEEISD